MDMLVYFECCKVTPRAAREANWSLEFLDGKQGIALVLPGTRVNQEWADMLLSNRARIFANRDIFKWIYRNWRLAGPTHVPSPPPGAEETLLVVPLQLCLMCLRPVKPPCFFSVDNPQTYQILRKRKKNKNLHNLFSFLSFFLMLLTESCISIPNLKERKKRLRDREYKPLHEPLLRMLPQACLPPICWAGCPAHWEWLSAPRGSTLTAQFPERGESEAQPGRLSIMFKQQGLDWLWHPYNSNYRYQWHNKRALFSKKHQTVHIWISYLGNEKSRLGFLSLFFWKSHVVVFLWALMKESSAESSLGVSALVYSTQSFLLPLTLPV